MTSALDPRSDYPAGTGQAPGPGRLAASGRENLLTNLLDALGNGFSDAPTENLDHFLNESSPWKALARWVRRSAGLARPLTRARLIQLLNRDIALLDALLTEQVNAILHDPGFQRLEAAWRGLRYLVEQVPEGVNIKVRILSLSWKELARDLERALEFDQSQLFKKIYGEEFGTPGGEPFGVLLGDYEIHRQPSPEHAYDDLGILARVASVAAAAFAPFLTGVHPSLLGLDSFAELERPLNLARAFEGVEYLKWRALRQSEDARFIGLTLPRVLLRMPYTESSSRVDAFRFREEVGRPDRGDYLWGPALYAFGAVLVRAFGECGWFAEIRGVPPLLPGGGVVTDLPVLSFRTDKPAIAARSSTDIILTDFQEKELTELGFIPLCHCPDTELAVFYSNQSLQRPADYDRPEAGANARLSAMLQYMLCVSRFAHYLKVMARDKIGSFAEPAAFEEYLRRWLLNYVLAAGQGDAAQGQYPLREAKVEIREHPGKPGSYLGVIHLQPHFQLDQVVSGVRLMTEMAPPQPR